MTPKFELLNTFHVISVEEIEQGNLLELVHWCNCRSHKFQFSFHLWRRVHLMHGYS